MRKKDGKVGNKTVRKKNPNRIAKKKQTNKKQIQILAYVNARKTKSCLINYILLAEKRIWSKMRFFPYDWLTAKDWYIKH